MTYKMRDLTYKQAAACENAIGHVCKCRCGGAFHGKGRGGLQESGKPDRRFFQELPDDDPHHHAPPKRSNKNAIDRFNLTTTQPDTLE